MQGMLSNFEMALDHLASSRAITAPERIFEERLQEMDEIYNRLTRALKSKMENTQKDSNLLFEKLNLLSPLNILSRGYSIAWKLPQKDVIKSSSQLQTGDSVEIRISDGRFNAKVEDIY